MAVVQSLGALADIQPPQTATSYSYGSMTLFNSMSFEYSQLYKTQPNVRTCVDFLARNIAQLGLHVFRRVSDTDRQRLIDHPLAVLLDKPNPWTTRYRLIEGLVSDLGLFFNAYWMKTRWPDGRLALLRLPPQIVRVYEGVLVPVRYEVTFGLTTKSYSPDEVVHFRGYNPEKSGLGLSPLETLRNIINEEYAATDYREQFWRNAARMNGVIERPKEAPEWSETARERFRQQFEAMYSGGVNSGKTAILEEGMQWKQTSFSAQESEFLAGRKLTREDCARMYHIPLPMVGILDHATFSNIKEQHKQLYQDCLGPWLRMIEEEISLQLLANMPDSNGVYCEFNIHEKLQGSFEEQIQALQSSVGRPWMTADEARARMNLPSMGGDAAQLVTPLNVLVGGQASPRDSAPDSRPTGEMSFKALKAAAELDPTLATTRERHIAKWAQVIAKYFERQRNAIIGRVHDDSGIETVWIDGDRWDGELSADLLSLNTATACVWGEWVMKQLEGELDVDRMGEYLATISRNAAGRINAATRDQIVKALASEVPKDSIKVLFEIARGSRSTEIATTGVTGAANFGAHEGAKQGGLRTKTWVSNSANPREDHAAMAGETVGIGDLFSNGMRWPGDPAGGAENNANCQCSVAFGRD